MTGNLAMGGFKLTGLAAGTDPNDSLRFSQLGAFQSSVSALSLAADEMVYANGVNTAGKTGLTAFARTLLDDVDAATARTTLGAQAALGFTPVEQNGGTNMGPNKLRMGWHTSGIGLLTQVDTTTVGTVLHNKSPIAGTNGDVVAPGAPALYACRAWVNFNGQGTVAIRASGNVSSITDNGTGDYTINFTVAMPDANYVITGVTSTMSSSVGIVTSLTGAADFSKLTTSVQINTFNHGGVLTDYPSVNVAIFR